MTRVQLIDRIAEAIATMEGFYSRRPGAMAQKNSNPGNVRQWRDAKGRAYPTNGGYVDFQEWAYRRNPDADALSIKAAAEAEGWRVLKVLIGQYIDGRYTAGKPPTFLEMFRVYAPAADRNKPDAYARFVARKLGTEPDKRIADLIEDSVNEGRD